MSKRNDLKAITVSEPEENNSTTVFHIHQEKSAQKQSKLAVDCFPGHSMPLRSRRTRDAQKQLEKEQQPSLKMYRKPPLQGEELLQFTEELATQMSLPTLLDQMYGHLHKHDEVSSENAQKYKEYLEERTREMETQITQLQKKEKKEDHTEIIKVTNTADQILEQLQQVLSLAQTKNIKEKLSSTIKNFKKLKQELDDKTYEAIALRATVKNHKEYEVRMEQKQMKKEQHLIQEMNKIIQHSHEHIESRLIEHMKAVQEEIREKNERYMEDVEREIIIDKPTYAEITQFPPLPQVTPKLIISPKDKEISLPTIKKVLNSINMNDLPKIDCQTTKQNKMIITCKNRLDLEVIKEKIKATENMAEKVEMVEPNPRTTRVIIFGAPEAPQIQRRENNESLQEEVEEQLELYEKQILQPALKNVLKKEDIPYKLIRTLKGRQCDGTSHLVIQLLERDATVLMANKMCIGFNRCTVKRHIFIQRCFNCQQLGHMARTCQNPVACAHCGKGHNVKNCAAKYYDCVNCRQVVNDFGGNYRAAGVHTQHPAYDPKCSTYLKKKQEAVSSLSKTSKNSN